MDITQHINYIKENDRTFLMSVHAYMKKTNWTWYGNPLPPELPEIQNFFYKLLEMMEKENIEQISSGGFFISTCDDFIKCEFGESDSPNKLYFDTYDINKEPKIDEVLEFLSYLCYTCPELSFDYLKSKYIDFKNEK